jgi:hypothetical protein
MSRYGLRHHGLLSSLTLSAAWVFISRENHNARSGRLPTYVEPGARESLEVIVGDVHHMKKPEASLKRWWLTFPERGLHTGIAVVGALGSGKTSCCMYSFAEQILADTEKRIGGLVLEVGRLLPQIPADPPRKYGRESDVVDMSLESAYRYNPCTTISRPTRSPTASHHC